MPLNFDEMAAEVARDQTVNESAITLINSLADQIEQNANDPVALAALVASLRANSDALAAAVEENTEPIP